MLTEEQAALGLLIFCLIMVPLLLGFGLGKEVGRDEEKKRGKHSAK